MMQNEIKTPLQDLHPTAPLVETDGESISLTARKLHAYALNCLGLVTDRERVLGAATKTVDADAAYDAYKEAEILSEEAAGALRALRMLLTNCYAISRSDLLDTDPRPDDKRAAFRSLVDALEASGELQERERAFSAYHSHLEAASVEHWKQRSELLSDTDREGLGEGLETLFRRIEEQWDQTYRTLYQDYLRQARRIGEAYKDRYPTADRKLTSAALTLFTGQESAELTRAAADAPRLANYKQHKQGGWAHEINGEPHWTRVALTPQDIEAGYTEADLTRWINNTNADGAILLHYACGLLLADRQGWLDLNDLVDKIGWDPRSTREREQARSRVWDVLRFAERAKVVGRRTIRYKGPGGKEIDTYIEAPLWGILDKQMPMQLTLTDSENVPVRAKVVISDTWRELLTNPATAQFLPLGEILASLPSKQAGGAWGRTIGYSLARHWRIKPREVVERLAGSQPTRRQLLELTPATDKTPEEILRGPNPVRAIEYFQDALNLLAERDFLAREGAVGRTATQVKNSLPRQGWQGQWLDEQVDVWPGEKMLPHVLGRASALPPLKRPASLPIERQTRKRKKPAADA